MPFNLPFATEIQPRSFAHVIISSVSFRCISGAAVPTVLQLMASMQLQVVRTFVCQQV